AQLEKAQRANKRQAAPFSKGEPKKNPKSTARPSGAAYGKHGHRPIPPDDQIDEILNAPLPDCCPHCAGDLAEAHQADEQFDEEIKQHIRDAQHLTPDETGWRLGGQPVWLLAWVADDGATFFAIDPHRSAKALEETIGIDWSGAMTHDGYSSYDRFVCAVHQQ